MHKKYGNEGKPKPIPGGYNQSTDLLLYRPKQGFSIEFPMATGRWTDLGFLLKYGSIIKEDDNNEQYVKDIKKQLEDEDMFEYSEENRDFSLLHDIYLCSPATAGRLVLGYNTNGYEHWKNSDGVILGHLLWPDDATYY